MTKIFRTPIFFLSIAYVISVFSFAEKIEKVNDDVINLSKENENINNKLINAYSEIEHLRVKMDTDSANSAVFLSAKTEGQANNGTPDYALVSRLIGEEISMRLENAKENQKENDYVRNGLRLLEAGRSASQRVIIDEPTLSREEIDKLATIDTIQTEKYERTREWLDDFIKSRKDREKFGIDTAVEYIENSDVHEIQKYALLEELNAYVMSMSPESGDVSLPVKNGRSVNR